MGATNFRAEGKGQTMAEAFAVAKREAQYEYGHRGYTGTLAEKPSAIQFHVPADVDPETFIVWIEQYAYQPSAVPAAYVATVQRASKLYEDKWGPACAVQVSPGTYVFFGLASC